MLRFGNLQACACKRHQHRHLQMQLLQGRFLEQESIGDGLMPPDYVKLLKRYITLDFRGQIGSRGIGRCGIWSK